MSAIKLIPSSGGGSVSLVPPSSTSGNDVTLTLPTTSRGFGKILQVVSTLKNDTFTTTSTTYTDITGLSVDIQPTSTASKVLVNFNVDASNTTNHSCRVGIFKGSANLLGSSEGNRLRGWQLYVYNNMDTGGRNSFQILDSPSSTETLTYKVKMAVQAGTGTVNRSGTDVDNALYGYRSASSITVMEVAA